MKYEDVRWYVIENDLIGGWSIGTEDRPVSQYNYPGDYRVVADVLSKELGQHIVDVHNTWLEGY